MATYNGTVSFIVSVHVDKAEADDQQSIASSIMDALNDLDISRSVEAEDYSVDIDVNRLDLTEARKTFEVSIEVTRTQRIETTILVAAQDEDEARQFAERDYDPEDLEWSEADIEDTDLDVQDVTEYSDDETDADYEA